MHKLSFHDRLRLIRLEQGLSLRQAAQRAEVPISTYREWEAGRKIIGEPYEKIAYALNVTLYTLLTGKVSNLSEPLNIVEKIEAQLKELKMSLASSIRE
jgi:transcriptional regulator with XRE-family HTH domain